MQNYSAGVKAAVMPDALAQWQTNIAASSFAPYQANVVWQDTTSNATYCSVSSALTSGG